MADIPPVHPRYVYRNRGTCGEGARDGKAPDGDGCDRDCRLELIPGAGGASTNCIMEWLVDNPTKRPLYDRRGRISSKQTCRDKDKLSLYCVP